MKEKSNVSKKGPGLREQIGHVYYPSPEEFIKMAEKMFLTSEEKANIFHEEMKKDYVRKVEHMNPWMMGAVDTNRCGELKFFEGSKELDPDDVNLWDKVDSSVWIEAYDKSGENMPNYMKDLYKQKSEFQSVVKSEDKLMGAIFHLKDGSRIKIFSADPVINKELKESLPGKSGKKFTLTLDREWFKRENETIDDYFSRVDREGKQGNRLFRRISKALYKAQIFLVKATNDIFRRSRNL